MKNKILWSITDIAIAVYFISLVVYWISKSNTAICICLLANLWVVLFYHVNKDVLMRKPNKKKEKLVA